MTRIIILIIALFSLLIASCSSKIAYKGINVKNWKVVKENKSFKATFDDFSGDTYQNIELEAVTKTNFKVQSNLVKGSIIVYLVDQNKKTIWSSKELKNNIEEIVTTHNDVIKNYQLFVKGKDASGKFVITWN
ncbi:conserved protein of unknown function [Tenacibaculum sp. 190130A14a]|uniref:Lipoprotein n=1 Tax=Tenacibaculum polynesiense TaxID=3137857 RepID=A0ABM9PBW0_9FLAO